MSWSASTLSFDKNHKLDFNKLTVSPEGIQGPMLTQLNDAIDVANLLLKSIPGPVVRVSLSGHANGVGWNKKDGYGDDYISVSVYQITD